MPMRVMGLDYSAYKKQYDNIAKMRIKEKGLTEAEYLSRMRKEDKLSPVVSVVVYWGEKEWDGAKNLHGMLDISEEIRKICR